MVGSRDAVIEHLIDQPKAFVAKLEPLFHSALPSTERRATSGFWLHSCCRDANRVVRFTEPVHLCLAADAEHSERSLRPLQPAKVTRDDSSFGDLLLVEAEKIFAGITAFRLELLAYKLRAVPTLSEANATNTT